MSKHQDAPTSSRPIVFFGMRGAFSLPPLRALLDAGQRVVAVVVPGLTGRPAVEQLAPRPRPPLSLLPLLDDPAPQSIVELAWERAIPVLALNDLAGAAAIEALAAYRPALAVVACFSRRIPPALLAVPRAGFWNIHPSLLPRYRGPAPLFWTLRDDAPAGVTLHRMDRRLDTGPLIVQAPVALPDGADGPALDTLLATRGTELLLAALDRQEEGRLETTAQPPGGSAAPWPTAADFAVDPRWSARRAFRFMRGVAEWRQPFYVDLGDLRLGLAQAIGFEAATQLEQPFLIDGRTVRIQCNPGVIEAAIRD